MSSCTNVPVASQELLTESVDSNSNESEDDSSSDDDNSEQSGDGNRAEIVTEEFDHLLVDLPDIS